MSGLAAAPTFVAIAAGTLLGLGLNPLILVALLPVIGMMVFLLGADRRARDLLLSLGWLFGTFITESSLGGSLAEDGTLTFSPMKLVPFALLLAGGLIAQTTARPHDSPPRLIPRVFLWLWLYIGWLAIASVASPAPGPALLRTVQALIPALVLAWAYRVGVPGLRLLWMTVAAAALHLVLGFIHPGDTFYLVTGRVTGYLVANAYTFAATITLVTSVGLLLEGKLSPIGKFIAALAIPAGVYGIFISGGRTGFLAAAFGIGLGAAVRPEIRTPTRSRGSTVLIRSMIFVLPVLSVLMTDRLTSWFIRGARASEISSFTGRTEIWRAVWKMTLERPLVGYGPGALRFDFFATEVDRVMGRTMGSAHNSAMEALASAGFPGAVLWVLLIGAVGLTVFRSSRREVLIPIYIMLVISAMSLGTLAGFGLGWYALLAVFFAASSSSRGDTEHLPRFEALAPSAEEMFAP